MATPRESAGTWLTDVSAEVGLDFVHESGAAGGLHLPEIMGAGAALFDADGDGDLDAYLTSGHLAPEGGPPRGGFTGRFWRQEQGRFVDATADSGLGDPDYGTGVAVGDVDNDGDLDVYAASFGGGRLYRNRSGGRFDDVTEAAGIHVTGFSTSAVFCDYDLDGFLDLYVARYVRYDPRRECHDSAGRRDYCTPQAYDPEPDVLLHNEGGGRFRDISAAAGLSAVAAAGLGVVCEDFDEDGRPDFYVANDKYPNHLWLNQGGGVFREQAVLRGAAYNLEGRTLAGMGVLAADLDLDGDPDLHVTNLETEPNTLYRNLGGGLFEDATAAFGLVQPTVAYTGFGVVAFDLELDGDLDLAVANGRVLRRPDAVQANAADLVGGYGEHNLLLVAEGGMRFQALADLAPGFARSVNVARGLAAGDYDGDGDIDLLCARVQDRASLFRNDAPRQGDWLIVRAIDPRLHRDAFGARVSLFTARSALVRTIGPGGSYLSSGDPRAHFGIARGEHVERIEVRWPDGLLEQFPPVEPGRELTLERGRGAPAG